MGVCQNAVFDTVCVAATKGWVCAGMYVLDTACVVVTTAKTGDSGPESFCLAPQPQLG